MREGLDAYFPVHLHDLEMDKDSITAFAPPRPVNTRVIPSIVSSLPSVFIPMEDVIRVGSTTIRGQDKTPEFEIFEQADTKVEIQEDEDYAS